MIPRITGTGWAAPAAVRRNDDKIFGWLRKNTNAEAMFDGYAERRVLQGEETLIDIMVPAAKMALRKAGKKASDVDILLGTASISTFVQPSDLSGLHKALKLPSKAWVVPVDNDYSNFAACLLIADGLLKAGRAKTILICTGGNWSRNVDYKTPQAVSAADAAGAAVVEMSDDKTKWWMADSSTVTNSSYYGTMHTSGVKLKARPALQGHAEVYSPHFFQITDEGLAGFKEFGAKESFGCVKQLLERNKLTGMDITFMPHQTSSVLIDYWCKQLTPPPAQVLTTLKEFANITVATHAVNLAWFEQKKKIQKDNLVMMALGPDMHANAILLKRG